MPSTILRPGRQRANSTTTGRHDPQAWCRWPRTAGGIIVPPILAVFGINQASGTTNAPFRLKGDLAVVQYDATEWPNPLAGGTAGQQQDAFPWRRPGGAIGAWVRSVGDSTVRAQVKSDTTLIGGWTAVTESNRPTTMALAGSANVYWSQQDVLDESCLWKIRNDGAGIPSIGWRSIDGGDSFVSTTFPVLASGATIAGSAGLFLCWRRASGGLLNNNPSLHYTVDGTTWTTVTTVPVVGASRLNASRFLYDAANARILALVETGISTFSCELWSIPVGDGAPTWTQLTTSPFHPANAAQATNDVTELSIVGGYLYLSVCTVADGVTKLWRAPLANLSVPTVLATLTGFTGRASKVRQLADGAFYALAPGNGLWRSPTGGAGDWTKISSNTQLALPFVAI